MVVAVGNLERMEIGDAGSERLIEDVVTALEARRVLFPAVVRLTPLTKPLHYSLSRRLIGLASDPTTHGVQNLPKFRGRDLQSPPCDIVLDFVRWPLERHCRFAAHVVQSFIEEDKRVVAHYRLVITAALLSSTSAHLEDIDEVGFQRNLYKQLGIRLVEIRKLNRVIQKP